MSVYIIQAGDNGPIKIGESSNPCKRLRELQVGNHKILELIWTYDGKYSELEIHNELHQYKIYGEWFEYNNHVIEFIKSNLYKEVSLNNTLGYFPLEIMIRLTYPNIVTIEISKSSTDYGRIVIKDLTIEIDPIYFRNTYKEYSRGSISVDMKNEIATQMRFLIDKKLKIEEDIEPLFSKG